MPAGFRRLLPNITSEEFAAIDAIRAAYLACNSAPGTLEYEVTPRPNDPDYGPPTAMGFLAQAGRTAWIQVGAPADIDFWGAMGDNGENAFYQWKLYLDGILEPGRSY